MEDLLSLQVLRIEVELLLPLLQAAEHSTHSHSRDHLRSLRNRLELMISSQFSPVSSVQAPHSTWNTVPAVTGPNSPGEVQLCSHCRCSLSYGTVPSTARESFTPESEESFSSSSSSQPPLPCSSGGPGFDDQDIFRDDATSASESDDNYSGSGQKRKRPKKSSLHSETDSRRARKKPDRAGEINLTVQHDRRTRNTTLKNSTTRKQGWRPSNRQAAFRSTTRELSGPAIISQLCLASMSDPNWLETMQSLAASLPSDLVSRPEPLSTIETKPSIALLLEACLAHGSLTAQLAFRGFCLYMQLYALVQQYDSSLTTCTTQLNTYHSQMKLHSCQMEDVPEVKALRKTSKSRKFWPSFQEIYHRGGCYWNLAAGGDHLNE